jgi:hypothetical protein
MVGYHREDWGTRGRKPQLPSGYFPYSANTRCHPDLVAFV